MLKVIKLNDAIRVVCGDLYEELDVEWDKYDLKELKTMLEILLDSHRNDLQSLKKKTKSIEVHNGAHHIDVVEDGGILNIVLNYIGGSLNILKVVDHLIVPAELREADKVTAQFQASAHR